MRPHTHKVFYGNGRWVFANRMEYDGEDRLITKWVGGMPMEEDRFLQEVNYAYDRIGRLIRINNPSTFLCNIGKEVCDFSLKLDFPLLWGENCNRLSGVKINGQVYPLATSWDLLAHQSQIAPAIEEALHAYGLEGEVSTRSCPSSITFRPLHFNTALLVATSWVAYGLKLRVQPAVNKP